MMIFQQPECLIIILLLSGMISKEDSGQFIYQQVNKFVIQFTNWGLYSGTGSLTYQIVLQSNNQVYFYYNNMAGSMNSCTVGIENGNGTDGLQIAHNATYVQNDLAVKISAEPDWLVTNNFEGTVYNGNSFAVVLDFLTTGLELGQYSMDVVITSNDPKNQQITIPVVMHLDETPVELLHLLQRIIQAMFCKMEYCN